MSGRALLLAPATSYRVGAYLDAARALGLELCIASDSPHAVVPEGRGGVRVDLGSGDEVVARAIEEAARRPFAGVLATDDATVELASRVAEALGLPHHSPEAARIARRKDLARQALERAGLPVPRFERIDVTGERCPRLARAGFPCVVKPLALAGSRGVIRADTPAELERAVRRVAVIIAEARDPEERRFVLVEDYLPGRELALEGLLSAGELEVLALFAKPDPLEGPFFEETYYVTPAGLEPALEAHVRARVAEACAAYGLRHGPVHAELRLDDDGEAWVLEVAARTIGGDCARLLRFGTGASLETLVLAHAVGRPLARSAEAGAAGVLMIPTREAGTLRRVEGVLAARRVPYVEDVVIAVREGYELVPLPEGSSYLGFIFARAPTPERVEQALRRAHACLRVVVAPVWRLAPAASG